MKKLRVYKVWSTDGKFVIHEREDKPTLEEFQKWVGGYIEQAKVGGVYFYVNEEGLLQGLSRNVKWPQFVGAVVELPPGCRT